MLEPLTGSLKQGPEEDQAQVESTDGDGDEKSCPVSRNRLVRQFHLFFQWFTHALAPLRYHNLKCQKYHVLKVYKLMFLFSRLDVIGRSSFIGHPKSDILHPT